MAVVGTVSMTIAPSWPVDMLVKLRPLLKELQRHAAEDPHNTAIAAIEADLRAAIAKLEPLAQSTP